MHIPEHIVNAHDERIAFAFTPGVVDSRDIVVIGHGVTSDKDRPWSEGLSGALHRAGVASLRIAFSGNGQSGGSFADATITKEVADLDSVIDALPVWRVSYVGHSMGGAVGLLTAAHDSRLHSLVSLAAVTHTAEFVERVFGHLQPGEPMLDKEQCPFSSKLRADLTSIGSVVDHAASINVPWLIVHGSADDVVPTQHSLDLVAAAGENAELVRLPDADHPFTGDWLAAMIAAVVPWLVRRCR